MEELKKTELKKRVWLNNKNFLSYDSLLDDVINLPFQVIDQSLNCRVARARPTQQDRYINSMISRFKAGNKISLGVC